MKATSSCTKRALCSINFDRSTNVWWNGKDTEGAWWIWRENNTHTHHFWWTEIFRISFLNREYYYTNVRLKLSADNFNSMKQTRKPGRPREWVLNEETIEIHKLSTRLKTQNPRAHWSAINDMLKTQLEQMGRKDLLLKIDKLWGLMRPVIPLPLKCICGNKIYS